jgi:thiamine-phosphate pyrophosphorylase
LLYLISNRRAFLRSPEITHAEAGQLQIETIRAAIQAGCRLIQIREKDLNARSLCEFARAVLAVARPHGARVLINDRLDVALATRADGVHLRVSSLPAPEVRAVGAGGGMSGFLIGVSTHSLAEVQAAESGGADFVVCGPVYPPHSKSSAGPPMGIESFTEICQSAKIPVLALGGVDLSNFRELWRRGAAGMAAIGLFTDRQNIKHNVETILEVGLKIGRRRGARESIK